VLKRDVKLYLQVCLKVIAFSCSDPSQ